MTVSTATSRVEYAGNGSTTAFAINFPYQAKSHIVATLINDSTEAETAWALTTNYTLSDPGATGTLTALVAPASGYTLRIERTVPLTQTTDYIANDSFPAETHEAALDKLVMIDQQLQRQIDDIYSDPPSARAFLSGTTAPADSLGSDGDTYLDTVTGLTYVKASGSWALDGGDLTGPKGDPGITTVTGGVTGDTSSTIGNIATFDTTLGTSIEDSGVAVSNVALLTGAQTIAGVKTFTDGVVVDDAATITGAATLGGAVAVTGVATFAATPIISSADAGSSGGPVLDIYRNSASPADSDFIGEIKFNGKDDGGTKTTYSQIVNQIQDVTNGTEDAQLFIQTMNAGSLVTQALFGSGIIVGGASGGYKGAGTVNATGYYVNGSAFSAGKLGQQVTTFYSTANGISNAIPLDNTTPQISEGEEIMTLAITPANSSSVLKIEVEVPIYVSTTPTSGSEREVAAIVALFLSGSSNALASRCGPRVKAHDTNSANGPTVYVAEGDAKITHILSAGSTSARTYRVRVGIANIVGGGTVTVNGTATLGGTRGARMTITEILP